MPPRHVVPVDKEQGAPDFSRGRSRLSKRDPGRKLHSRRYPWATWFSKPCFSLKKGVDFNGRTYTMAQQIRNQACRRKISIRIEVDDDEQGVTCFVDGGGVGASGPGGYGVESAGQYQK